MAECRRVCAFWLLLIFLFTGNFENCDAVTPKRNKFTIGHLNICGLLGKLDLLTLFIEKHNFDIFGVTESLLNKNIPTSLLNIKGYPSGHNAYYRRLFLVDFKSMVDAYFFDVFSTSKRRC